MIVYNIRLELPVIIIILFVSKTLYVRISDGYTTLQVIVVSI